MNRMVLYLARRYAQAFYNVYGSGLTQEDITRFIAIAPQIKARSGWTLFFSSPLANRKQQSAFIERFITFYHLPISIQPLLEKLSNDDRMMLLPETFELLVIIYDHAHGIERFLIESSCELSEEQVGLLKKNLEDKLQKTILVTMTINPDLIAGLSLSSKTHRFDYSVARILNLLKRV